MSERIVEPLTVPLFVASSLVGVAFLAGFWLGIYACRSAAMDAGVGRYENGHFIYGEPSR